MSGMNQYLVHYRNPDDIGFHAQAVTAHRVEGWAADYAFFGHAQFPAQVTKLIPRALVREVELSYDEFGNEPNPAPGGHMERQATAFYQAVDRWRIANPGVRAVIEHDYAFLEQQHPPMADRVESKRVSRDGWGEDEAGEVVDALADDLGLRAPTDEELGIADVHSFEDVVGRDPRTAE